MVQRVNSALHRVNHCVIRTIEFSSGHRGYYMAARGYEFYLGVLRVSLTDERNERVRDTFSTRR